MLTSHQGIPKKIKDPKYEWAISKLCSFRHVLTYAEEKLRGKTHFFSVWKGVLWDSYKLIDINDISSLYDTT